MPFQSQAQRSYLYAKHPDVAKKFEADTSPSANLPDHALPQDQKLSPERTMIAMKALIKKQK